MEAFDAAILLMAPQCLLKDCFAASATVARNDGERSSSVPSRALERQHPHFDAAKYAKTSNIVLGASHGNEAQLQGRQGNRDL